MSTVTAHISALYKNAPVYLWVEDEETRAYLDAAWGRDGTIGMLVAGGCENIGAVVHAARKDGLPHVFGYRDRDFGATNRSRWNEPDVDIFVTEAFELENLMLDPSAMEVCDVNTTQKKAADFENEMRALAAQLDWWMACRRTIVHFRDALVAQFIEHPPRRKVMSFQNAFDVITTSAWWTMVRPGIGSSIGDEPAKAVLKERHEEYAAMLDGDLWRTHFSGKEIFLEMRSRVWTKKQQPDPQGRIDFVKAIALAQRKLNTVPKEVADLRLALRARVGR